MTAGARSGVRNVGEFIAALGVILSLVFVGLQIRQTAAVASAQATQDLAAMSQEWLLTMATDADADRIFLDAYWDTIAVAPAELSRARYIMIAFLRRAEAAYVQVERGLLPETALDAYGMAQILSRFENPRFLTFWAYRRGSMDPGFVSYVEQRSGYASGESR